MVVAAVIEHGDRFLLTRRQDGVHLAGMWEFPGGKIGAGESHADALRREIVEELDSDVVVRDLVLETTHAYPDRTVTLFFYRCDLLGIADADDRPGDGVGRRGRSCRRSRFRRPTAS